MALINRLYIFPLSCVAVLIFLFAPPPADLYNGRWSASAKYEGGTGENQAHTNCLRSRAKRLRRRYSTAVEDYKSDVDRANKNFREAEVIAEGEYLATLVGIYRVPVPLQAKFAMHLAAKAKQSFSIGRAWLEKVAVEREAKSDFNREEGTLDAVHEENIQDCWDLHVQPELDFAEQERSVTRGLSGSVQTGLRDLSNSRRGTVTAEPVN